jgi:RND family efflux transporter MFP subunit
MRGRLTAATVLMLLTACGRGEPDERGASAAGQPAAAVPVVTVLAQGGGRASVEVPGSVEAARTAKVASRVAAAVLKLDVDEGARIRKGELLVVLDGRDIVAAVGAAEARLAAARAQRDRIRSLLEKEAATRQEMEAADADYVGAASSVSAARAQLDYIEIRAPFDGRVAARRMQAGDLAVPGQEILVLEASGLRRVVARVSGEQAARLELHQHLTAVLDEIGRTECIVSVINPSGDPSSRRFLIKCDLPAAVAARSGSFARLELPAAAGEAAPVWAPRAALVERGGLTGLFVVRDGVARLRWIDPGVEREEGVVVRAGLAAGEEVILDPGGLTDGAPVSAARREHHP